MKGILSDADAEILTLSDLPEMIMPQEKGMTFKVNALTKARFIALKTHMAALADDSGLEVDALGLRPGIRSSRYAGPVSNDKKNIEKVLEEMKGVPAGRRSARFRCVIAYVEPGGGEVTFEGTLTGEIAEEPKGQNGFGYDPIFIVPGTGKTLAEITSGEKNAISHRAQALKKLKKWFEHKWGE